MPYKIAFDELDINPYVVQFYCQDSDDLQPYIDHMELYLVLLPKIVHLAKNGYTAKTRDIGKPEGLLLMTE